jgi:hypothetical protein
LWRSARRPWTFGRIWEAKVDDKKTDAPERALASRMNWPTVVAVAVAATALGAVIGFAVAKNRAVELQIRQGERSALLKISGGEVNYEQLLATFFEPGNEWLRGAAKTWLLEKQDIVSITATQLAEKLEAKACGEFAVLSKPSPDKYFEDLDNRGKCAQLPNVKALRQLRQGRRPPFHDVAEVMNATIPRPDSHPMRDTVNVCTSKRELDGVRIELVSPNRSGVVRTEPLIRTARARMECGQTSFTQMHLRPEDATELTGEQRPNMPVAVYFSRVSQRPGGRPGQE